MNNIEFEKPIEFSHTFTASVTKHPEVWAEYTFIAFSVFSFLSGILISNVTLLACGLLLFLVFFSLLRTKKKLRKNPIILEASDDGIWFPHWRLFIPRKSCILVNETSQRGYVPKVGPVTLRNLALSFEATPQELSKLKRRLIWPTPVGQNSVTGNRVVRINLPYTTGQGSILDISKPELLETLRRLLSP